MDTFRLARWQRTLGVLLIVGIVGSLCWLTIRRDTYDVSWTVATRDLDRGATSPTLLYFGGPCDEDASADAEEDSETVTIRVTVTLPRFAECADPAERLEVQVTLDEPLGTWALVDASTGEAVVPGRAIR